MKSYKKGHELDELASIWINEKNVFYVWGAARAGTKFIKQYKKEVYIRKIFDIDSEKQGKRLDNIEIVKFEPNCMEQNAKIVVCTSFYTEVKQELLKYKYKENIDFIELALFRSMWDYYKNNMVFLPRVDLSITSKCTLRCEKCNMLMPYYIEPQHKDFEIITQDLDALFRWVDIVKDFMILGGEPLLFPNLVELLQYIKERYQKNIEVIHIFTNGTCVLTDGLLKISEEMSIVYDLSDYTVGLPQLTDRVNKFERELQMHKIEVNRKKQDYWQDFGYPEVNHEDYSEEKRIAHFHSCGAPFRGLYNKRLYYCHLEASAVQAGLFEESDSSFVELDKLNEENKIEVIECDMGYSKNGYPGFCLRCDGCGSPKKIPVAKQWRKR